jgi:beta-lactamase class A
MRRTGPLGFLRAYSGNDFIDEITMLFSRRILLAAPAIVLTGAAQAEDPPALADYERQSGGRIGLYAENLKSGKKIAWRAEERFVMCSTFKASLVACTL